MIEAPSPKSPNWNILRTAIVVVVAAAVAALVLSFVLAGSGGSSSSSSKSSAPKPAAASLSTLQKLAGTLKHPLYWAGAKKDYTYELTKTKNGNVYVRYLPPGIQVGDPRADFLTVGTYPTSKPMARINAALKRHGTIRFTLAQGGIAVQDSAHPTSVYLTYPKSNLLLEVFEPSPAAAKAVVQSGAIKPIG